MCFHKCIRYFNIMPVWNWNLWLFIMLYRFYLVLGLNKSARYRLIIVITTHMINDCGSILVKDNGLYCSNCVDYVSQCIAMTVYLLVYIWYTMHWTMLEKVCVVHFENLHSSHSVQTDQGLWTYNVCLSILCKLFFYWDVLPCYKNKFKNQRVASQNSDANTTLILWCFLKEKNQ